MFNLSYVGTTNKMKSRSDMTVQIQMTMIT